MKWLATTIGYDEKGEYEKIAEQTVEAARFEVHSSGALLFFNNHPLASLSISEPIIAVPAGRWISVKKAE